MIYLFSHKHGWQPHPDNEDIKSKFREREIVVEDNVTIGNRAYIANRTHIGKSVTIGNGSWVGHRSFVHEGVTIGNGAYIKGDIVIGANSWIGDDVYIATNIIIPNNASIPKGEHILKSLRIDGSVHELYWYDTELIHINHIKKSISWWFNNYKSMADDYSFTDKQTAEYFTYIKAIKAMYKIGREKK